MKRAISLSETDGGGAGNGARPPGRAPRLAALRHVQWWEWAALLGFTLVWLAVFGPRAFAQAGCRIDPLPLAFGTDIAVSMTVKAGRPCPVAIRNASAVISHFAIDAQPSHGLVQRRGRTGVLYRAHPQYRGDDTFVFALTGSSSASAGTAIIRVKVTVL